MTNLTKIYQPNVAFDFEKIRLLTPNSSNSNYLIKFRLNDSPIYIQTPKCLTKNGIFKSGKNMYCDLVFSNENNEFIRWMEYLEIFCKRRLFEKRKEWFENDLDENDIDIFFTSPFKFIKSGHNYIVRAHVPTILGSCNLKIYNENEDEQTLDVLTEKTQIVCILEIQGIKCSPKIFQVEIGIKQIMILEEQEKLFSKCAIQSLSLSSVLENDYNDKIEKEINDNSQEDDSELSMNKSDTLEKKKISKSLKKQSIEYDILDDNVNINPENLDNLVKSQDDNNIISVIPIINSSTPTIEEFQFNLEELDEMEPMQIKNRNDIYYQLYKNAKRKAKIARDLALSSYLQAKQIKNIYMIDDIKDSDSDYDDDNNDEDNDDDDDEKKY